MGSGVIAGIAEKKEVLVLTAEADTADDLLILGI